MRMRFIELAALGVVAALALSACTKNANSTNESQASTSAQITAGAAEGSAAPTAAATGGTGATPPGASVYQTNCASCHQADGKGVAGAFPPLAGNPTVTGDPKTVIHIVKYGLSGKIAANGHSFNGIMPPWGSQLSDADIAAAITFIRSSWGNEASPVSADDVAAVAK
jgi:mono/diheme cytochrome c family protein